MATILIVDDDADIRDLVEAMLRSEGHEVLLATNGNEGLRVLESRTVALVLCDLMMPEKEGIETIQQIRAHHRTKVIAMSGGVMGNRVMTGSLLRSAKHLGADDTLGKPFSRDELLGKVNRLLASTSPTNGDD